jgi:hypothetical protein
MNKLFGFTSKLLSLLYFPSNRTNELFAVLSVDSIGKWHVVSAFENIDQAKKDFKMGDVIVRYTPTARIELTFTTSEIK